MWERRRQDKGEDVLAREQIHPKVLGAVRPAGHESSPPKDAQRGDDALIPSRHDLQCH